MPRMYDDPTDEMQKGPHAEPDGDEMDLDALMSGGIEGEEGEDLFPEDPLESALASAGFENLDPEKLARVKAILTEKPGTPSKGPMGAPAPKGPMGAAGAPPPKKPIGGAVPAGMPAGMNR